MTVAVLGLVAAGCTLGETELAGRFICWPLEADDSFGRTREIPEADIELFSRPGRHEEVTQALVLEPLGVATDGVTHVQRTNGPCGEHDVFVRIVDDEHCITVVGRQWWDQVCRETLGGETVFDLDLGEAEGHGVLLLVGSDVADVLADSGGFTLGAFPVDGYVLLTSPEPLTNVRTVTFDGQVTPTTP